MRRKRVCIIRWKPKPKPVTGPISGLIAVGPRPRPTQPKKELELELDLKMYTNCCTVNWSRFQGDHPGTAGLLACNWKRQINKLPDVPQAVKKQSLSACQPRSVFQLVSPPQAPAPATDATPWFPPDRRVTKASLFEIYAVRADVGDPRKRRCSSPKTK